MYPSQEATLSLLGIPDVAWSEILCYLTWEDLLRTDATCSALRRASDLAWNKMHALIPTFAAISLSEDCSKKECIIKYHMASSLARHMQITHRIDPSEMIGQGPDYPDLDLEAIKNPSNYDFFCRTIYEEGTVHGEKVLWEGFVPTSRGPTLTRVDLNSNVLAHQFFLGMREAYTHISNWSQMTSVLESYTENANAGRQPWRFEGNLGGPSDHMYHIMENLSMTVVAVSKAKPYKATLVAVARRFNNIQTQSGPEFVRMFYDTEPAYPHKHNSDTDQRHVLEDLLFLLSRNDPAQFYGLGVQISGRPSY